MPISFILLTFALSMEIQWTMAIDEANLPCKYDMIIVRDSQQALGLDILWSKGRLQSGEISIPTQSVLSREIRWDKKLNLNNGSESYCLHQEGDAVNAAHDRASQILDAKYEKANIDATEDACQHLSTKQKKKLKFYFISEKNYLMAH